MDPTRYVVSRGQFPPVPQFGDNPCETFSQPPLDGTLCISEIYEWHALHSPNHPVFQYLADDGTVATISYKDSIQAMYRGGWLFKAAIEHTRTQRKRPTIAVLSISEPISYTLTWLSSERAGFTLFPISPRNSPVAVAHLLTQIDVDLLLVGREPFTQDLAEATLEHLRSSKNHVPPTAVMPNFVDFFPTKGEDVEPLPPIDYEAKDITMIIHSSGSTAFPKPIPVSFYRTIASARMVYYGEVNMTGMRIAIHSIQMYHGMGLSQMLWAAAIGTVLICNRPTKAPSVSSPGEVLRDAYALNCDLVVCTPSFAEAWAKNREEIKMLQRTRGLVFGGGPLGQETGDFLVANGINLYQFYGCTECGNLNMVLPKESLKDWEYISFAKPVKVHWIPDDKETGTSKLVLMAGEMSCPSVLNCMLDGVGGFDTNDLFTPHPTNPDLWKIYGRADDQIMHSNGEKTNPGPIEAILIKDGHVANAVMFGRGYFNAGVLVDPVSQWRFDPQEEGKLVAFRNMIWPTVEKMNRYTPQHSRVFKEMILVTLPDKPFMLTAKGTPRRQAILDEYAPEIKALYSSVEQSTQSHLPAPRTWDAQETNQFVRAVVTNVIGQSLAGTQDLFKHGCDSLQATWIRNSLLHALRATSKANTRNIPFNFVYDHPTISRLATYVASVARSEKEVAKVGASAIQAMHQMLDKYSQDFPTHNPRRQRGRPIGDTVFVTGTTGGLGCALLSRLWETPEVVKIYAFNRKGKRPLRERQRDLLLDRGYPADSILDSSKVVLLQGDLAQPNIGLSQELYTEVQNSVTHIIHNAWPVNFNYNLSFFESSVHGLRNLVNFALTSPQFAPPRLLFISSVGILRQIDRTQPVKEVFVDANVAVGIGYSESKWICEQLLALASRQTPLVSVSMRVGQIAGSDNGAWSVHEWIPSLIKSSIHLGCIPMISSNVSWMNATTYASAIVEARNVATELSPLHLAHPRPTSWTTLFEPVMKKYNLQPVPYDQWFPKLVASMEPAELLPEQGSLSAKINPRQPHDISSTVSTVHNLPALKLLPFFSACNKLYALTKDNGLCNEAMALPRLDVTNCVNVAARESLSEEKLKCLGPEDMHRWLGYWERVGYLPPVRGRSLL